MTKFLLILTLLALLICFVIMTLATIGAVNLNDGCFYRYNSSGTNSADAIANTILLKANANYTILNNQDNMSNSAQMSLDPNKYGSWLNSNLLVVSGQNIKFNINGEISLCRAYLPTNNLQSISNLDIDNKPIPIPRINEVNVAPLSLIFNAKSDGWRNITEFYDNDRIVVSVSPNQTMSANASNIIMEDNLTHDRLSANCSPGQKSYSPICGLYSIYSGQYISGCNLSDDYSNCNPTTTYSDWHSSITVSEHNSGRGDEYECSITSATQQSCDCSCGNHAATSRCTRLVTHYNLGIYYDCSCNNHETLCDCAPYGKPSYDIAPAPYQIDGANTIARFGDISNFNNLPIASCDNSNGTYAPQKFWFSAADVGGLLYRIDDNIIPTDAQNLGTNYQFAQISIDQTPYSNPKQFNIIYKKPYTTSGTSYLQYRFLNKNSFANNNGGYVLNIKHTKCVRTNGNNISDSFEHRGMIEYMIVPFGRDPNSMPADSYQVNPINVDQDGNVDITIATVDQGYLWMRILNNPDDYVDSSGDYSVRFETSQKIGTFNIMIIDPLLSKLSNIIKSAGQTMFKNMTCYNEFNNDDTSSCSNFFHYITTLLSLYVITYGAMFALGIVKISQMDLFIRIIKISLVGGLMNQQTFEWFNFYIFDFVTGFSNQIIANMSGYSLFSSTNNVQNPFMFMDAVMSKIFFSNTFLAQFLALISMGIGGILYFMIVFIALIIVIISVFRIIAVYLMATLALALLIGLAPLFLTFMLFDFTKHLFDNWVKFTVRYMLEPVILLAGSIVLMQLFTIYLDFVLGYSVCWKCAIPITLPFSLIPEISIFANYPIFCINWFAPWGIDNFTTPMGMNMQHVISLIIIAYCMYGYLDLSDKIIAKIVSGNAPSASRMGAAMMHPVEHKVLKTLGLESQKSREQTINNIRERIFGGNNDEPNQVDESNKSKSETGINKDKKEIERTKPSTSDQKEDENK